MRIAIANAKGGVAKTTSSIYIASVIVSRGGRAVCVQLVVAGLVTMIFRV